ncbi:hypothetical protein [Fibrella aquatilis]|uniref:Uncharacterized protein n=1 Tax=Fibrella aquatilis TaxID=2817059 RepID=A0A939G9Z1_9BACT|nr:hypothetical protein [Fibrella aquatilis]MBO0932766.1 hypothetical protein [Fibrella aquatilis]
MNVIEQHVELTDDTLTVPIPADWRGKGATLKLILDEEVEPVPVLKPKIDLTQFGGKFAYLSSEATDRMLGDLDNMRNEWERDI